MGLNVNYVYPAKAKYILEAGERFVKKNSAKVEVYENATILPVVKFEDYDVAYGRGGVVDCNGNYVESSKTKGRIGGKYVCDDYEVRDEKVVFCGFFNKMWGHYLTEVVSRLWYVLKNDETIDSYVLFRILKIIRNCG